MTLAVNWWHESARKLRAGGSSLPEIAAVFGVTRQRVHQVCRGIVCPVDHAAIQAARFADPAYRAAHWKPRPAVKRFEGADFIRENYGKMTATEIGRHLGISKNAVIGRARDLGLQKSKARSA